MKVFEIKEKNIKIQGCDIKLGNNITFGNNINISVINTFELGDNSHLGNNFTANCENLLIGEYFYNNPTDSRGLTIGGGGSKLPFANVKVGDRVVCHTGHWNCARSISIGNDVGLSHDVDILTHGFWGSILEGYPSTFNNVEIGNNVILGWKSLIMPGVSICDNCVIGANSIITRNLFSSGIYAGNPAKFIRQIVEPSLEIKQRLLTEICEDFKILMSFYDHEMPKITSKYPYIFIDSLIINVKDRQCKGNHTILTDVFRDHLRRYGIRVFHPNGFSFKLRRL